MYSDLKQKDVFNPLDFKPGDVIYAVTKLPPSHSDRSFMEEYVIVGSKIKESKPGKFAVIDVVKLGEPGDPYIGQLFLNDSNCLVVDGDIVANSYNNHVTFKSRKAAIRYLNMRFFDVNKKYLIDVYKKINKKGKS